MENRNNGMVMIVDDSESEIDILVDILHTEYAVCVATDGESALETVREVRPDLILLDVLIPGMDGHEICRRLKNDPDTADISIIFVTVLGEEGHEAKGFALGALDYITKPFNRDLVLARVRNHMALIEAYRLKEDVNRIISHDMRNELSMIVGYPEILLDEPGLSVKSRRMIEKLRDSGYLLINMVNLSLQLYKMERGLYQFQPEDVDILKILYRIIDYMEGIIRDKAIQVDISIESRIPRKDEQFIVTGEQLLLHSMLSNLVVNAFEASPAGEIVTIDLRKETLAHTMIHNMGAVPADIRARFFEKYTTAGKTSGTGLGTYSAMLIAKTHGGNIHMYTSEEKGTLIEVQLPMIL